MVSTGCDYPATDYLIYTIENSSVPLKNGLFKHKSKKYLKQIILILRERLGPGACFFCVELKYPWCLSKNILAKKNKKKIKWLTSRHGALYTPRARS